MNMLVKMLRVFIIYPFLEMTQCFSTEAAIDAPDSSTLKRKQENIYTAKDKKILKKSDEDTEGLMNKQPFEDKTNGFITSEFRITDDAHNFSTEGKPYSKLLGEEDKDSVQIGTLEEKAECVSKLFKGELDNSIIDGIDEKYLNDGLKKLRQITNSGNLSLQISALMRKDILKREGKLVVIHDMHRLKEFFKHIKEEKNREQED